jgi:hypothetical protein
LSARLHFIVEGLSEENFVNRTLGPYLGGLNVFADVTMVTTRLGLGRKGKGGGRSYDHLRQDLLRRMHQDKNDDARFTTMFDLYALPRDFPGFAAAATKAPVDRVTELEAALSKDILNELGYYLPPERFIPYIQLHEFEALVFADPTKLDCEFIDHNAAIGRLINLSQQLAPEVIDDGAATAPSKRIIKEIPEYDGCKASAGPLVADKIGLPTLRARCPHFAEWLAKIEVFGI